MAVLKSIGSHTAIAPGTFEPQMMKKNQPRIARIDNQSLSLHAKMMTSHEISAVFKELYNADISSALVRDLILTQG